MQLSSAYTTVTHLQYYTDLQAVTVQVTTEIKKCNIKEDTNIIGIVYHWPTVLSVEPLVYCVVCLSICLSVCRL